MKDLLTKSLIMLGFVIGVTAIVFFASGPPGGAKTAGGAPPVAPGAPVAGLPAEPEGPADLVIAKTGQSLEASNPHAAYWANVPGKDIVMLPQNLAMPMVTNTTVAVVTLKTLTDGASIAWRLSWKDDSPDGNVDTSLFTDGVALQFPLDEMANYTMGQLGARVQILHWTALWQKDIDVGFQDVEDLHPNFWYDLYWFAEGEFPFPVEESFKDPRSLQWFIAQQAGNPMAVFSRSQPVEELVAEGFGTLTHQQESMTSAKGAWKDGQWAVVLTRPLETKDPLDYQFTPGMRGQLSVAVWDGAGGNVGGRKNYSAWTSFTVAL